MAGRKLTDRDRQLRKELVEVLVKHTRYLASDINYTEEDVVNVTHQVLRCAKTLGFKDVSIYDN